MNSFEFYLLQSSFSFMIFYLFYMARLKKETMYQMNRMYLLTSGIFSITLPLFRFSLPSGEAGKTITYYLEPVLTGGGIKAADSGIDINSVLWVAYIVVSLALLVRFFWRLYQITKLGDYSAPIMIEGHKTILLDEGQSPFSFFKTIFLPKGNLEDPALSTLILHEEAHIKSLHSLDIVFFEAVTISLWFNPFVWLMKKELEAQHEFIADTEVIDKGLDSIEYKSTILTFAFRPGGNPMTNNFNSLLKRRFEMLAQEKSSKYAKLKFLLSVPLMALVIMFFGMTNGGRDITTSLAETSFQDEEPYTFVDEMPSYPKGQDALLTFISGNVVYPAKAKKEQIQGKVIVGFIVEKDGSLSDIKVLKGIGGGCDEEAIRVTKLMGKWNPGKDKGKPVRVRMVMPYQFKLM
ncbi:MAG: M56 family metallopeptidase [Ignavibacteria bacterium]|jgi:TonB family protein|nr:M56 family metallopeptidase [Ignavibacteria bacterium]MCU7503682.1 M56 family metallopeptidase [Ignavibacteria bacterium]MCU7517671.1 M56 family metallopeptidase [Ignavibacteria bacterium]